MNKFCVYTAIAGDYDPLRTHPVVPGVDWVAFLDETTYWNKGDQSRTDWDVRRISVPADITHPRMRAKWYKVLSQLELPEYEHTMWVDGKIQLKDPAFVSEVLSSDAPITMFRHPDRDCIYDEASSTRGMRKYRDEPIDSQVLCYSQEYDHPSHWGLWETGIIGRRRSATTERIERSWWHEIERWSYQDQLSLPVVLRAEGCTPGRIRGNMWNHPAFSVHTQPGAE